VASLRQTILGSGSIHIVYTQEWLPYFRSSSGVASLLHSILRSSFTSHRTVPTQSGVTRHAILRIHFTSTGQTQEWLRSDRLDTGAASLRQKWLHSDRSYTDSSGFPPMGHTQKWLHSDRPYSGAASF
jgi:hypothetical protein